MDTPIDPEKASGSPSGQPVLTRRQKAVISWVAGITITTLVVASLVAWYHQPSAMDVARQYLTEQGVATDKLEPAGFREWSLLPGFMNTATSEFWVDSADPRKKVVVDLFRPVYFTPWHGTAFQHKVEK